MTDSIVINQRMGGIQSSLGSVLDSVIPPNSVHVTSSQQSLLQQFGGSAAAVSTSQSTHLPMSHPSQPNGHISCKDINVSLFMNWKLCRCLELLVKKKNVFFSKVFIH